MNLANLTRCASLFLCGVLAIVCVGDAGAQLVPRPAKKGKKFRVRIDSAPQQSAIYLDDEKYGIVGYTPWTGKLRKGDWKVILKKDGFEIANRVIQISRSSRVQEAFIPMVKKVLPAILEVRAEADKNSFNSEVWVDGQLQGSIPVTLKLSDGRHLVEIKKEKFEVFTQWVTVRQGERLSINPMLKARHIAQLGSILVTADVTDAEVYLDGNVQTGQTPMMLSGIAAGPHVIEVRKTPALPWRQTVQVDVGKTTKVVAGLGATAAGQGGNIRVLSNIDSAIVYLDGEERGAPPVDLKNVAPGEHVVEVRAAGIPSRESRVTVAAGAALVVKLDMDNGAASFGVIKVVSPIPEAEVYIDGQKIGPVPQQKRVSSGEHFVVVSKPGYKAIEEKYTVVKGQEITVTAELKAAGSLRVLSNPGTARIMLDGKEIGVTPMVDDEIAAGEHVVVVSRDGYKDFNGSVTVEGGNMTVVNAVLEPLNTVPTAEEAAREQRGLSSLGALVLPAKRSTVDLSTGYPYYFAGGITVGAGAIGGIGFDAGVDIRTYFARTDLALRGRFTLLERNPFTVGAFGLAGFGGELFGDSDRSTVFADVGVQASLTGLGAVTVTGKTYLNFWSDRHCPKLRNGGFEGRSDPVDTCVEYNNGTLDAATKTRIDNALGEGNLFKRDNGSRFIAAIAVEVAIQQQLNAWIQFETGFFDTERAAFMGDLYGPMFEEDQLRYVRAGVTYKF